MIEEFVGKKVVVDCQSHFVCLGLLKAFDEHFLDLRNCDLHDLRDTDSTRELYIASSAATGIKRNRKRVILNRREVVGMSLLEDVVDE
jgi:small nuclear ribonucleoprotein (snRNP)-like protein